MTNQSKKIMTTSSIKRDLDYGWNQGSTDRQVRGPTCPNRSGIFVIFSVQVQDFLNFSGPGPIRDQSVLDRLTRRYFEVIQGSQTKAKLEIRAEQTQKSNSKWFSFKYWSHYWPHPSKTGSFSQSESFIHDSLSNHLSFEITQFLNFWNYRNRVGFLEFDECSKNNFLKLFLIDDPKIDYLEMNRLNKL